MMSHKIIQVMKIIYPLAWFPNISQRQASQIVYLVPVAPVVATHVCEKCQENKYCSNSARRPFLRQKYTHLITRCCNKMQHSTCSWMASSGGRATLMFLMDRFGAFLGYDCKYRRVCHGQLLSKVHVWYST